VEKDWRDNILEKLIPETKRFYLFFDPDFLFKDEVLNLRIREKGFETVLFENELEFRINYEQKVRRYTDTGISKEIIILVHEILSVSAVPFDIVKISDAISCDYTILFPHLDRNLIQVLPGEMLDKLYQYMPDVNRDLSYQESCKYILRTLYAVDTDLINNDVHLLRFLLHLHYDKPHLPRRLLHYILDKLKSGNRFRAWNLELLIFDDNSFFRFLSERMQDEKNEEQPYEIEGPAVLPFSRKEIQVYLDNLIEEGYIEAAQTKTGEQAQDAFVNRIENLRYMAPESYEDWLSFSNVWAEKAAELYCNYHPDTDRKVFSMFEEIKKEKNNRFASWLQRFYGSLYNYPPSSPSMVHHVPRYLSTSVGNNKKVALVVIDGLAYSQWKVLKEIIQSQAFHIHERSLFAWIPTLTTISRQALLSGKIPLSIEPFLRSTNREEKLWKNFWEDNGVDSENIFYDKLVGDKGELDALHKKIRSGSKAAAIIIGKIDSIAHGQQQGSSMMHKEIAYWGETDFLDSMLSMLFQYFDEVYITSDHGNEEARGIGKINQGVLVQEKGLRCRIYNEQHFLDEAALQFPQALVWPKIGLPDTYMALIAPAGEAFAQEGTSMITHGGISIDEVIVPFITITKGTS
jgi:hypothetical protein